MMKVWITVLLFIVRLITACPATMVLITACRITMVLVAVCHITVMRVGLEADLASKMANTVVEMLTNFFDALFLITLHTVQVGF